MNEEGFACTFSRASCVTSAWVFLMLAFSTQNMEYKFIELLSCEFHQSSEEVIRQQMSFRYNALKSKLALMHVSIACSSISITN